MKARLLQSIIIFLFIGNATDAITVSGKITNVYGEPLPFAAVAELRTTNGVYSDFQGCWTLTLLNDQSELEFSFLGYQSEVIQVLSADSIFVQLKANALVLKPVVVVGYATNRSFIDCCCDPFLLSGDVLDVPVLGVNEPQVNEDTFIETEYTCDFYPNPTRGKVTVKVTGDVRIIDVLNTLGERVSRINVTSNYFQIDLSQFTSGTYIMSYTGEQGQQKYSRIILLP